MKGETISKILNPGTTNLDSLGGGGFEAITGGDIGAVMLSIDAPPLIWAYLFSYYDIGLSYNKYTAHVNTHEIKDKSTGKIKEVEVIRYERSTVSCSLNAFSQLLGEWVYSAWLNWSHEAMAERVKKAAKASDEVTSGLAKYLSLDPQEEVRIAKYFKPMPSTSFDRKYRNFSIMASKRLFPKMKDLSNKIHQLTKNEENY